MRSIWKGSIGFGLVSIPVKLYSAVQTSSLDFDMLDSRDHARIRFQRVNENTHKEVPYDKIVKGYKLDEDYVIMDEQDFEDAAPEKSKVIEIESFVDIADVNPMFYETSYYTEPDTKNNKAYALLIQALTQSKKAGLARFVLRSTESLCIVHPLKNVLVVTRIRFGQEIRDTEDLNLPDKIEVSKKELDMGLTLINQYAEDFDVSKFKDEYNDELLRIIEAKSKGKRAKVKKLKPRKTGSDDLYDQLMASLKSKKGA
ncbi:MULTISPECIES: non-homologous end joining protein Ku [Mucilaginibacter]|uniref:Non-homologous end joining protein Ku n=1 Tax=Mucilaginibacter rubeus TaxID=2027860 RepID=A0AAE6MKH2_9SPHI|nr:MULTISPECIES: Ku protein [Mucilaginibacter]QEM06768.1 Ku protein [Mucilaginibacter rubeus]QEM19356.1 Ku protein [Mucilaginibacter gossypii]QTE44095.1 Ku protein [Mucilaginibacter rubeus]QTE50696.1 Ku protein [Mucilaginibacter rubeus]QTE55778.1 Ku protein [Mucilaginibacter rubeus]